MTKTEEDQQMEKARLGYQTAIELVGIVSQEIYSRFSAMLIANSIIIAIVGWAFTSERSLPPFLLLFLPVIGFVLCSLWFLFVYHGVYWQNLFRKEAIRLEEEYFSDTFKLISLVTTENSQSPHRKNSEAPRLVRWFPFHRTSGIVIIIFAIVYIVMFLYQIICNGA